jgi:hypothetical protein
MATAMAEALVEAAGRGNVEEVRRLLDEGADMEARGGMARQPLIARG